MSGAVGRIARVTVEEWRLLLRSRLALTAALLGLALVVIAAWVSVEQRARLDRERAHYQGAADTEFQAQPDRHPHRMVHYGQFVFRPIAPLAFFDFGVDAYTGSTLFLEGHRQNSANFAEVRQSSLLLRFGQLSPALVLQTLVPLLLVFLGFASVSRERESGNLRLLLAQGLSGRELLAGKWLGHAGVALAVASPALLALLVGALGGSAGWNAVLSIGAAYVVYLLGWSALTVLVSAWSRHGRDALLALVGLWIVGTLLVPRIAPNLALQQIPLPTRVETEIAIGEALRRIGDSHNPDDPYFNAFRKQTLDRYGVTRIEDLPVNWAGLVSMEGERLTSELFDRHAEETFERERRQVALVDRLAWISPLIGLRRISMHVAGSDLVNHQDFLTQAEAYRYRLIQDLNRMHAEQVHYEGDRDQRITSENWAEVPAFAFVARDPFADSGGGLPGAAAALIAWFLALLGLLAWRGHRLQGGDR